jgi:predicted transcriptional regulator
VANRDAVQLQAGTDLRAGLRSIRESDGECAVIVDGEHHVLGTLSKLDVLEHLVASSDRSDEVVPQEAARVEDVMVPTTVVVSEDTELERAAAVMACTSASCLPVFSIAGTLVGTLSARDVLRGIAMSCGYVV